MSTLPRSRTGCTFCKARRKKCDETKPQCLRCQSSGRSCNYEFVEYPGDEGFRGKRTKPAPRTTRELLAKASKNIVAGLDMVSPASSLIPHDSDESSTVTRSIPLEKSSAHTYPSSRLVVPRGADASFSLPSFPPALSHSLSGFNVISSSLASSDLIRLPARVRHLDDLATVASGSTPKGLERLDRDEGPDDDSNPDRARVILRRAPSLDKNIKENSLPFVLHCYSEWAIAGVFEPLKVVHTMRDQVTAQFSSENTRVRAILLANVMDMFAKNFAIDGARKSILNRLALDVRKSGAAFMATRPSIVPVLDKQNAIRTLDTMIEILGLQLDTCPMFDCIQTLESAAPVFRRACPGIPGRPVNLPNILLDLSLNLRHFATIDIIMSMLSGLPTCIEYEVPFSLELCDRIYYWQLQGNYGLQWLYGLPDQFIVLFAWINSLSETPEASDNSELIGWIERILPQVKVGIDESGDPALRTGKMVVLESWWYIVPIYLYMVLCKADANDPRVVRAQRGFMRLIKGVRLGRHPDAYLIISMTVAGVATTDERERDTLRRRIMGIPEYAEPGTTGNDIMLILEDIWARTRDEGRAATWSDMRVAYFRVSGR